MIRNEFNTQTTNCHQMRGLTRFFGLSVVCQLICFILMTQMLQIYVTIQEE